MAKLTNQIRKKYRQNQSKFINMKTKSLPLNLKLKMWHIGAYLEANDKTIKSHEEVILYKSDQIYQYEKGIASPQI